MTDLEKVKQYSYSIQFIKTHP